jgi:hypothetical protein
MYSRVKRCLERMDVSSTEIGPAAALETELGEGTAGRRREEKTVGLGRSQMSAAVPLFELGSQRCNEMVRYSAYTQLSRYQPIGLPTCVLSSIALKKA